MFDPEIGSLEPSPGEGTGTRDFYSRFETNDFFEGGPFQLRLSISRIDISLKWWECGCQVHGDKKGVKGRLGTNIKRSCILFAIKSIALTLGHLRPEILRRSALSLIGSPGTLCPTFRPVGEIGSRFDIKIDAPTRHCVKS